MPGRKAFIIGAIAISFAAIMWGLDGVVLTPRLYNLDVGLVVFILHLIPFLLMQLFLFREYRHLKTFRRNDYILLLLIALFGGAIGTLSIAKALFLINFKELSIVVLLQKLQPVFAILLATLLLKERINRYFILWASVALLGGYFMTFGFKIPDVHTGSNTALSALFALLAAFSFGSSTVFSKMILRRYSFSTATFYRYGFTTVIMLSYVIITGQLASYHEITRSNWIIFIIIAVTTGSGAIFLYYYGLNRVKATVAVICELFFPISTLVFDYFINGTRLSAVQWASAALMVIAIINLNRTQQAENTRS
ncbi:MAG: DMT family transporter [Bacteroidales bacterium]|jgi:drug/metabolite transporter (DMT)-like permease|nr:DMT family transporter [Bacteroidales bacterium]